MAQIFVTVHLSVVDTSRRMLLEVKRHNYVTPTNYLELVSGYKRSAAPHARTHAPHAATVQLKSSATLGLASEPGRGSSNLLRLRCLLISD